MVTSGNVTKIAITPFNLPYPKTPCYKQTSRLYVLWNQSYCQSTFYTAGIGIFNEYRARNLDFDLMTFMYEHDPYLLEIYQTCIYELPTSRHLKVIIWRTDRHNQNYIPCHFVRGRICRKYENATKPATHLCRHNDVRLDCKKVSENGEHVFHFLQKFTLIALTKCSSLTPAQTVHFVNMAVNL